MNLDLIRIYSFLSSALFNSSITISFYEKVEKSVNGYICRIVSANGADFYSKICESPNEAIVDVLSQIMLKNKARLDNLEEAKQFYNDLKKLEVLK